GHARRVPLNGFHLCVASAFTRTSSYRCRRPYTWKSILSLQLREVDSRTDRFLVIEDDADRAQALTDRLRVEVGLDDGARERRRCVRLRRIGQGIERGSPGVERRRADRDLVRR